MEELSSSEGLYVVATILGWKHDTIVSWGLQTVLELPGCHTQGKTLDELVERTKEAIRAYLETIGEEPEREIEFVGIQEIRV